MRFSALLIFLEVSAAPVINDYSDSNNPAQQGVKRTPIKLYSESDNEKNRSG
jgi:hypothetical protein